MMRVPEYDRTLGPCPWCSSENHEVRDDGLDIYGELCEDGEHRLYAQCLECSQISPSYPTIEKLREEWEALSSTAPPPKVWVRYEVGTLDAIQVRAERPADDDQDDSTKSWVQHEVQGVPQPDEVDLSHNGPEYHCDACGERYCHPGHHNCKGAPEEEDKDACVLCGHVGMTLHVGDPLHQRVCPVCVDMVVDLNVLATNGDDAALWILRRLRGKGKLNKALQRDKLLDKARRAWDL